MKERAMLTTASLLTTFFMTLHLTGDILFQMSPAGLVNLFGVLILVVQLYGTLVLGGRRAGYIIIFLGSLLGLVVVVIHMKGTWGVISGETGTSGQAFLFVWTLLALGITSTFSVILSATALLSLPWSRGRRTSTIAWRPVSSMTHIFLRRGTRITLCLLIASLASVGWIHADTTASGSPKTIHGLGTTTFPTSTKSAEAQSAFMRGLLLLHLFEYGDAADAFVSAQKLDPAFAMAYWGEAMTFNHGVWNQVDATGGRAALDKFAPSALARAERIGDPREKAYLAAVELLYDGSGSKAERDKRYAQAMEHVSETYPTDKNAQLFYALALLSQSEGIRDVPAYVKAAEVSKSIFRLEPNNPGAAHYWIHGMDDPEHAAGALEAARALSKIAPDAAHAQHMCSHIFMALGMWDDVVRANIEAIRVENVRNKKDGFPPYNCGHYAEWLEYGYFQQGRFDLAQQSVSDCLRTDTSATAWPASHPGRSVYGTKDADRLHHYLLYSFAGMRDVAIVESQDWTSASKHTVDTSILRPATGAWWDFTTGLAAAKNGDLAAARIALKSMQTKAETYRSGHDANPEEIQSLAVGAGELSGLIKVKAGDFESGLAEVKQASETYRKMAFAFGPPVTIKPPEELMGEILLEHKDAAQARKSFEQSLERAPGRALSLIGLARAERLAGDEAGARKTYEKLVTIWHQADAGNQAVEEARRSANQH